MADLFSESTAQLFTIGYQRLSVEQLVAILDANEIDLVVDVRRSAWSARIEWRSPALVADIGRDRYWHRPDLGNAKGYQGTGWLQIDRLKADRAIEEIRGLLSEGKRICLLCMEVDYSLCHRRMVAACVTDQVRHLPS